MPNGLEKDTNGYNVQKSPAGLSMPPSPSSSRPSRIENPSILNLWPDDVHSPFWPPVDQVGRREKAHTLSCRLEEMDRQLGRLFQHVQNDPTLAKNTIILACSDNGPDPGLGSPGPFRGYKTQLFEGGIRSSLVVWAPTLMNEDALGTVNQDSIFTAIDLVPSLLEICQASPAPNTTFDGEPLPDILLGESNSSRKKPIFFRRPPDRNRFYGVNDLPDLASTQWPLEITLRVRRFCPPTLRPFNRS